MVQALRAVIYSRVSTGEQDCSRQTAELKQWAKRRGLKVVKAICETASGAKTDRKGRQEVLELARQGLIDVVLVSELSRWSRSTIDLVTSIRELANRKVAISALNGPDFDISTAQGELMLTILGALATFERSLLQERVLSGIRHAQSKGVVFGRKPLEASPIVQRLQAGRSYRAIAEELKISKTTVMKIAKQHKQVA